MASPPESLRAHREQKLWAALIALDDDRNALWAMVEQIKGKLGQANELGDAANSDSIQKLSRLIHLHKEFSTEEDSLKLTELALLAERNMYLGKLNEIEELSNRQRSEIQSPSDQRDSRQQEVWEQRQAHSTSPSKRTAQRAQRRRELLEQQEEGQRQVTNGSPGELGTEIDWQNRQQMTPPLSGTADRAARGVNTWPGAAEQKKHSPSELTALVNLHCLNP
jgi:hypothetical protein